jgi:ATP-binding cassette subfamily F protein uup
MAGLVGPNGSGKSTLLRTLYRHLRPTRGTVSVAGEDLWALPARENARRVAAVPQERADEFDFTVREVVGMGRLPHGSPLASTASDRSGAVDEAMARTGVLDLEDRVFATLSGGERQRVLVARALAQEAPVVVLDEPTNHLDVNMIEQLEEELNVPNLTLLLVTHDRYFLDNVCDEIIEMEFGEFTRFKGNYSYYVEKKAQLDEVRDATQQHLRGLMRSELEWVRKMPRARGTKSKSRLDKFEEIKAQATRNFDRDEVKIDVKTERLGGKVIEARNLTKGFGDPKKPETYKPIVAGFSYSLKRGDRIGIVGPNGIGKSTFLDVLTERIPPDAGTVSVGDTVVLGVFDQRGLQLKEDKRIIEVVRDIAEVIPLNKGKTLTASGLLERFLFDKDQQYQYVSTLSGGERRRLYLCTVLMKNPNVLILDEPTNDLDIPTLNALEDFLVDLDVCLLIVSHDRFFMDKLCTKLLVFQGEGRIKEWVGSYTELRETQKAEANKPKPEKVADVAEAPAQQAAKATEASKKKLTYGERLELEKIEKEMPKLEARKEELLLIMAQGGTDHHAMMERSIELERTVKELDRITDRWLELSERAS